MQQLDNKIALVTGGTSGIGLATAKRLIDEGAQVVITGRNQETLDAALSELGERALGVRGDVADAADRKQLFATIGERFGRIDILFANAGVFAMAPFAEQDQEGLERMFGINFGGVYFVVQQALPLMSAGSSVVINTSVAGNVGMAGASVYSATKAALRSLVRTLAAELSPLGIRVNAVSPGPIETPIFGKTGMEKGALDAMAEALVGKVPLGRFGRPEEIANATLFLASSEASFVNGVELTVDGGMTQV
ncbi:glucose 1-dehydrogenase [Engelhardtia mirabilis]|uniref:Cyclopentanol dehydrogenase n=1 Tax=Engelhardtia mirabilis TaxID=2528011 RepID=A0A518BR67_9BACT|nr:Cyclopentanol dehydrogenase [Planctomycetes bacterium Pla133]QDV03766.1 Cyclopentanol dehydrogenase [Planctomycetes bacterium Pla86]